MIQARIHQGRIEVQGPIPAEWEGLHVKILPLTPDDPWPDLKDQLAALQALGPMEFESEERNEMDQALKQQDCLSREQMQKTAGPPS